MKKTEAADAYIKGHKTGKTHYRHNYHIMPPVGWMNDPNGLSYAFGSYHFFYQFHPYAAAWGPMHWGHYTSKDMIKWELCPTALAPDEPYDKDGCFSGSAIEKDGKLCLIYTAVSGELQSQALAVTSDGRTFEKEGLIVTAEDLPADASEKDFRDPKVFEKDGKFYMVVGSRDKSGGTQVLLYRSDDLKKWIYVGCPYRITGERLMCECPDYFTLGGEEVLFTSIQFLQRDGWRNENVHTARYFTGKMDFSNGNFRPDKGDEVDGGFDFYAPQTFTAADGRRVMMAWMQMWDRTYVTAPEGWVGAATLPRELTIKDGKLYQNPVREIENYRKNPVKVENIPVDGERTVGKISGTGCEIIFTLNMGNAERAGVRLFCGKDFKVSLYFDRASGFLVFDRTDMGKFVTGNPFERDALVRSVKVGGDKIQLRLFLDVSSVEVFVNGGERAMTGLVYPPSGADGITFFSEGGTAAIERLEKYDIIIE